MLKSHEIEGANAERIPEIERKLVKKFAETFEDITLSSVYSAFGIDIPEKQKAHENESVIIEMTTFTIFETIEGVTGPIVYTN